MALFGENIKAYRKANHMSQQQLADYLGIHKTSVSKIERGTTINLKSEHVDKLCKLFRCSPSDLIEVKSIKLTTSHPISPDQQKLISLIPLLDESQVKLLLDVVRAFNAGI